MIHAEGEFQAAARLADAADVIRPNPVTLQLRYLQALSEISANQGTTIVFPLPMDVLRPLIEAARKTAGTLPSPSSERAIGRSTSSQRASRPGSPDGRR